MPVWEWILRPLLFRLPAETVHHLAMSALESCRYLPGVRPLIRGCYGSIDRSLTVRCMGLEFPSPIGLAAGFDKDARWFDLLGDLGFGFVECGSVTGLPQPGNPRPRLFRLPADQAIVNRMGFNSRGSAAVAEWLEQHSDRLAHFRQKRVLGINLGKSKAVPLAEAASDYEQSLDRLFRFGDYFVINVSSPNTLGLRELQHREMLDGLLRRLMDRMQSLGASTGLGPRPLLLKIAPDLTIDQIDGIAAMVLESPVAGVIATNTTISRTGLRTPAEAVARLGEGGLSGRPLRSRSLEVVRRLHQTFRGRKVIVGVGGLFEGQDVLEMLRSGASLVQLYTGFIYGGPATVSRMHRYLATQFQSRQESVLGAKQS